MTGDRIAEFCDGFEAGRLDLERWFPAYLPPSGAREPGRRRRTAEIDVTRPHDDAIEWSAGGIAWEIDGHVVRSTTQSPGYPMQLMLGIYAFAPVGTAEPPRRFVVERVRGYPPAVGREG